MSESRSLSAVFGGEGRGGTVCLLTCTGSRQQKIIISTTKDINMKAGRRRNLPPQSKASPSVQKFHHI